MSVFSRQPAPKKVPRTIENTRIFDETVVDAQDEEVNLFLLLERRFQIDVTSILLIISNDACITVNYCT